MNEPKDHHYTPQFYLEAWCSIDAEDQASRLWVVENVAGKINFFRRSPKATGFEEHLYSFSDTYPGQKAILETEFFSRLDNDGSAVVKKLVAQERLGPAERGLWAAFLVYMRMRTPEGIELVKETGRQAFLREVGKGQSDYEALREDGDPDSIFEWIETQRPGITENFGLSDLPQLARASMGKVGSMEWHCLDFTKSTHRLLCSDRPFMYSTGIDDPDCIVALPLSPQHAFVAFYKNSKAERALKRLGPTAMARTLNTSVVSQARKRAYCHSRGNAPPSFYAKLLVRQEQPRRSDRPNRKKR